MTRSFLTALLLLGFASEATATSPLTTESEVTLGIADAKKAFVAVEETTSGSVTRFTPVLFAAPKWRRKRVRGAPDYRINVKDEETKAKTQQKAEIRRRAVDAAFAKVGAAETDTVSGGFTGRVRLLDMGVVVLSEGDEILARVGDASVMKKEVIAKKTSKLVGRCKGATETRVLRVAARSDWKAIAVLVEATCTVEDDPTKNRRVRKVYVKDVSKLID